MARPARPEPKVFLSDEVVEPGRASGTAAPGSRTPTDRDLLGEKSTSYLESAEAAIRGCRAVLGDARIVVQLRDPVERAVSNWRFSRATAWRTARSPRRSTSNLDGPARAWDPQRTSVSPYAYLERGRYAEQLGPWLDAFPGLVRVQFLEDLVADPEPDRRALRVARRGRRASAPPHWASRSTGSGEPADELDDDAASTGCATTSTTATGSWPGCSDASCPGTAPTPARSTEP